MSDTELQWIPDETTPAIPVRTRVISIVVFAAIFLAIGVVMGRLTAGIPAGTGSGSDQETINGKVKPIPG